MSWYETNTKVAIGSDGKNISYMFKCMSIPKDETGEMFLDIKPEYISYFKNKNIYTIDIVINHIFLISSNHQEFIEEQKYFYLFSNAIPERIYLFKCNLSDYEIYKKAYEYDQQRIKIREMLDMRFRKGE